MDWFQQLRTTLAAYYPAGTPADVVGYLQGSATPAVWRNMIANGRQQMIILGSTPPNQDDWVAAGVAQRHEVRAIRQADLNTFIIAYGGFIRRPWGKIFTLSPDLLRDYDRLVLANFRNNMPRKR
jgi:hypothetical protein